MPQVSLEQPSQTCLRQTMFKIFPSAGVGGPGISGGIARPKLN
jgi:hypothetical protein